MAKRRKPGRKSTGLTILKTFKVSPKTNRELAKVARDFDSEAQVIRLALDEFFLTRNVHQTDNDVSLIGQPSELQVA